MPKTRINSLIVNYCLFSITSDIKSLLGQKFGPDLDWKILIILGALTEL